MSNILRIAHRGGGSGMYENKIETIKNSLRDDAVDAIEIDVRVTRDHVLVVSHDRGMRANGQKVWIDQVHFSDIVHLGVVSLEELLPVFLKSTKALDIDIKDKKCVGPLIHLFKKYPVSTRVYFSSFDLATLFAIQEEIPHGQFFLSSSIKDSRDFCRRRIIRIFLVLCSILFSRLAIMLLKKRYRKIKLDGISLFYRFTSRAFVRDLKAFGFRVFVWGSDKEKDLAKMITLPIDGIKTKRVALLRKIMRGRF